MYTWSQLGVSPPPEKFLQSYHMNSSEITEQNHLLTLKDSSQWHKFEIYVYVEVAKVKMTSEVSGL